MDSPDRAMAEKCFKLIYAQANLMQTFVDDMLDLIKIKNGVFKLENKIFDPLEALELVCDTFAPQVNALGVQLSFSIFTALSSPPFESEDPPTLGVKTVEALPHINGD